MKKEALLLSNNTENEKFVSRLSYNKPLEQQQQQQVSIHYDFDTARHPDSHPSEILSAGLAIAFLVFLPDVFLSDPGDDRAKTKFYFGMLACLLFLLGGIFGCVRNTWWALAPAVVCQVVALAY